MTKTYEQEIAETIIAQMGGASRLHIMVGADSFASGRIEYDGFEQPYVQFKFKMNRKMNYCRVIYEEGKDPVSTWEKAVATALPALKCADELFQATITL